MMHNNKDDQKPESPPWSIDRWDERKKGIADVLTENIALAND
jgi:hypothetical protein